MGGLGENMRSERLRSTMHLPVNKPPEGRFVQHIIARAQCAALRRREGEAGVRGLRNAVVIEVVEGLIVIQPAIRAQVVQEIDQKSRVVLMVPKII